MTTEEGHVLVRTFFDGPATTVDPGMQAQVRVGEDRATLVAANLSGVMNWLDRRVDVDNESLGQVLQELSRYTARPLRAGNAAIAALRVSAVLRAGDIDALRGALKAAYGLDIEQQRTEWVVVNPKDQTPTPPWAR